MERMTVKRNDGRWALTNNDRAGPMEQMEKIPLAIALLAAYEDTGLTPGEIMVMCSMDRRTKMAELLRMEENKPLTSDELLKMDGTPVWITKMDGSGGVWMSVIITPMGRPFINIASHIVCSSMERSIRWMD